MLFEYRYDCYRGHFHILDNTKFRQQASYRKAAEFKLAFCVYHSNSLCSLCNRNINGRCLSRHSCSEIYARASEPPKSRCYRRVCLYPSYIHWYYCSNKVMGAQEYISHDQPSSWIHHAYVSNCLRV